MSILTGKEILSRLGGDIQIDPFNEEQLNPNSYNLQLFRELLVYRDSVLDPRKEMRTEKILIPDSGLVLSPGQLYLGRTVEYTVTENLVPCLSGRSSIGRLGIVVHQTACFGDTGFSGRWTLEITVTNPVKVYPNLKICQIYYNTVVGEVSPYTGRYQDDVETTPCRLFLDN